MSDPRIDRAQEQMFDSSRSSRQKYVTLVVGRPGFAALLQHELVVTLTQSWPGALGLALRKAFYPLLLGSTGRNVIFVPRFRVFPVCLSGATGMPRLYSCS